ncbi:hypothetical protein C2S51_018601 [Perilla frutescens var. frutescens]|nr:hypothetical protein C2S51_018601 [Perilla frutescens var. frutescens]
MKKTCFRSQLNEANMWHENLSHINDQESSIVLVENDCSRFEEVTGSVPVSVPNRSEDCNWIESISESNDALKNHPVVDDLEEPAAQIDDESLDGTVHVPTSVLGVLKTET